MMPKYIGLNNGIETIKETLRGELVDCGRSLMAVSKEVDIPEPGLNRFKNHGTGISPEGLDKLADHFGYTLRVEMVKRK